MGRVEQVGRTGSVGLVLLFVLAASQSASSAPSAASLASAVVVGQSGPAPSGVPARDPVARLQARLASGEVTLEFDERRGYLPSLLSALDIPASSQGLIFSKTSLQVDRIAPWSPRAVYFNDEVYVGWVQQGPIMEIASIDPAAGPVFYTLSQEAGERPVFQRETRTCLMCHQSSAVTGGVPGLIVRSMLTDRYGYPIADLGRVVTDDRTPLDERWGGWFVTGTSGKQPHAGNVFAPVLSHEVGNAKTYAAKIDLHAGANVTDLNGRFDTEPYLRPDSDLVALMVLAHQATVHNLITKAQAEARFGGQRLATAADALSRALFFAGEAPLASPVSGTSGFAAEFSARGRRDGEGRSLRDLDLDKRLFRYPLSCLIYSDSYDALPTAVKTRVARQVGRVLAGDDPSPAFAHIGADERQALREILQDTKPDLLVDAGF